LSTREGTSAKGRCGISARPLRTKTLESRILAFGSVDLEKGNETEKHPSPERRKKMVGKTWVPEETQPFIWTALPYTKVRWEKKKYSGQEGKLNREKSEFR